MRPKFKGLMLAAAIMLPLLALGQGPAHADEGMELRPSQTREISRDGLEDEAKELKPFARLKLGNGNAVSFFEIEGGGESAFGMLEEGMPGNPSTLGQPELAGKNALEVFHALAAPGT